jgi:succinate dehydrogenase / fumarate reductase cytochrome b subunit
MGWVLGFFGSSVGKKMVMAVTGVILFGFVVGHMIGNLQIYQGPEKLNAYAALLKSTGGMLWVIRFGMLATAALHIWAATSLTLTSWSARPQSYRVVESRGSTYASRTMRWGGPILGFFIVYHLLHLTVGSAHPSFDHENVFANVVIGFSTWWVSASYIVAMLALGLHLYHGAWSMFQTMGLNHPRYNPLIRIFATAFALAIVVGNISIPVAVLSGVVHL